MASYDCPQDPSGVVPSMLTSLTPVDSVPISSDCPRAFHTPLFHM
jgi:hypothetical protein